MSVEQLDDVCVVVSMRWFVVRLAGRTRLHMCRASGAALAMLELLSGMHLDAVFFAHRTIQRHHHTGVLIRNPRNIGQVTERQYGSNPAVH